MKLVDAERAMLEYAEKLTLTPSGMSREDVQRLRQVGWTDRDILDICQVTSYFNYWVRIADGLGVELEEAIQESAREGRERAQEQANQIGKNLPPDVWTLSSER